MYSVVRSLSIFIIIFLVLHTSAAKSLAAEDIALNEIMIEPATGSQWVELYNKGSSTVTVGGWIIDDSGGTEKFTVPDGTIIEPQKFAVFESSKFNFDSATSDTVKLLKADNTEVESYTYAKSPGANISFGRISDGSGVWGMFNNFTRGMSNNEVSPLPTYTPTPTVTASPTHTPTPSKTPTPIPTHTPSPSNSPTPTVKASATPTKKITPTKKLTPSPTEEEPTPEEEDEDVSQQPTPSLPTTVKSATTGGNNLGSIFIGLGIFFLITCGILVFYSHKKKKV